MLEALGYVQESLPSVALYPYPLQRYEFISENRCSFFRKNWSFLRENNKAYTRARRFPSTRKGRGRAAKPPTAPRASASGSPKAETATARARPQERSIKTKKNRHFCDVAKMAIFIQTIALFRYLFPDGLYDGITFSLVESVLFTIVSVCVERSHELPVLREIITVPAHPCPNESSISGTDTENVIGLSATVTFIPIME